MHDTLSSLVERALTGNQRPLEFYLRENCRLSGARINIELANDVGYLLASSLERQPEAVQSLIRYFVGGNQKSSRSGVPSEFVLICGVIAASCCAAIEATWRVTTLDLIYRYTDSSRRSVRDGVIVAYQRLLAAVPEETGEHLVRLAREGNYFQQSVAIAAVAEASVLYISGVLKVALCLQRMVLERLHDTPLSERKREDVRNLRRILGYTLSVITAAAPEEGFALMRECATWSDVDITWILRENLKKKRLARFTEDTRAVSSMLA